MSKKGFLLGVVLGGAAIATAVMKMDDDKKAELKAKAQQGMADFKDRAIDKAEAGQQFEDTKRKVADFADQYQAAKQETGESFGSSLDQATDSLRSELAKVEDDEGDDEDIVIDGGAAYQKAGEDEKTSAPVPESAPAKDATPAKSDDESTTDESSPAK